MEGASALNDFELAEAGGRTVPMSVPVLAIATVLFGLVVVTSEEHVLVVLATGLLFAVPKLRGLAIRAGLAESVLVVAVLCFGALGLVTRPPPALGPSYAALHVVPSGCLLALLARTVLSRGAWTRRDAMWTGAAAVLVMGVSGVLHVSATAGLGIDVVHLHHQAGEALSHGLSPYGESVRVFVGRPGVNPGEEAVGYPYPPLAAVIYGTTYLVAGDARYASWGAWIGVLAVMTVEAAKRDRLATYIVLLVAALPSWPLVLRAGWTEPMAILMIAASLWTWARTGPSALSLGLALATKQYFAVVAPVVLFAGARSLAWRGGVLGVIVATLLFGASMGPWLMLDATVIFLANVPPRPGLNVGGLLGLFGLSWSAPSYISLGIPAVAALALAWRAESRASIVVALAIPLTLFFWLTPYSGSNYWFISFALAGIGCLYQLPTADQAVSSPPT